MKEEESLFVRALRGRAIGRAPFWFMRQAGRYLPEYRAIRAQAGGMLDLCLTPELAAEVTLQPIRRFAMDAAILFADLPLLLYGLGQHLEYREGEGPVLDPVRCQADLASLAVERVAERLAPVAETVGLVRSKLARETALIGFAGSPWTTATYMVEGGSSRDFAHTKRWAYRDPDSFAGLIDLITRGTIEYLSAQIQAGADAVQLFDSWAGALSETAFERWVIHPTAVLVTELRARHPTTPIIGFPRVAGCLYERYFERTGVDAIGIDPGVPVDAALGLQRYGAVQGNIDPQLLVVGGPALLAEAGRLTDALGSERYIVNLGHGIVPETPVEHVAELSAFLRSRGDGAAGGANAVVSPTGTAS